MGLIFLKKYLLPREVEKVKSEFNGEIVVINDRGKKRLIVSGLTQSGQYIDQIWTKAINLLTRKKLLPETCLILGLGGGTVARICAEAWPQLSITGIEIDPEMIRLGKKYLGLSDSPKLKIIIGDALTKIKSLKKDYDLILVDLYKGGEIPSSAKTREFVETILARLSKNGMVVFNLLFYTEKTRKEAEKFVKMAEEILEVELLRELTNLLILGKRKTTTL